MRRFSLLFFVLFLLFGLSACAFTQEDSATGELVRTFTPAANSTYEAEKPAGREKRGIIKSADSPGGSKCAYIFTPDATADVVEYALAVKEPNVSLSYEDEEIIYSSNYLFDFEWGDDETLMVSLNEQDINKPETKAVNGVMVMFGRVMTSYE